MQRLEQRLEAWREQLCKERGVFDAGAGFGYDGLKLGFANCRGLGACGHSPSRVVQGGGERGIGAGFGGGAAGGFVSEKDPAAFPGERVMRAGNRGGCSGR